MTTIPTQDQTLALTRTVRSNALTTEQRSQVAAVLTMIGAALRVAAEAAEHADDRASAATVVGAWQPVSVEYARLLTAIG